MGKGVFRGGVRALVTGIEPGLLKIE